MASCNNSPASSDPTGLTYVDGGTEAGSDLIHQNKSSFWTHDCGFLSLKGDRENKESVRPPGLVLIGRRVRRVEEKGAAE